MTRAEGAPGGGPVAQRHAVVIAGGGPTALTPVTESAARGAGFSVG